VRSHRTSPAPAGSSGRSLIAGALLVSVMASAMASIISVPAAAQPEYSAEAFLARLDRALSLARSGALDPSPSAMESVRNALGLPAVISINRGSVSLAPDPFLERLEGGTRADFEQAELHLGALASDIRASAGAGSDSPERLREALDRAYSGLGAVRPGLADRVRRAIGDFLGGMLQRLFSFSGTGSLIAWIVIVALLALVLSYLVRSRLVPESVVPSALRRAGGPSRGDPRQRAEEALLRGDHLEAVRALYEVLLATLARRGIVSDSPSLTAAECRVAVAKARPSLTPTVASATGVFERVVYGGRPAGLHDAQELLRADREAARG
jgi:hypothetical protein